MTMNVHVYDPHPCVAIKLLAVISRTGTIIVNQWEYVYQFTASYKHLVTEVKETILKVVNYAT